MSELSSIEEPAAPPARRRWWMILRLMLLAVLALIILLTVWPVSTRGLGPQPDPAADYAAAVARFEAQTADEDETIRPECASRLLTEGAATARAIVLLHGIGSCPAEMLALGEAFAAQGYNVLIPRLPEHGFLNEDASALASLGAGDLRDAADAAVDIAAGLGDEVVVLGISAGGVSASWITMERRDVSRTVVVAPSFSLGRFPPIISAGFTNFFSRVPNLTVPDAMSPEYVYDGHSTRGLAEMFRLGKYVRDEARTRAPAVQEIAMVIVENDQTIDNALARRTADDWADHDARVVEHMFPSDLDLPNDPIDPNVEGARTDLVYPVLIALAEGEKPPV